MIQFPFNLTVAAPETRRTARTGGGVIRACAVTWAIVRPVCGAVAGMAVPSPIT